MEPLRFFQLIPKNGKFVVVYKPLERLFRIYLVVLFVSSCCVRVEAEPFKLFGKKATETVVEEPAGDEPAGEKPVEPVEPVAKAPEKKGFFGKRRKPKKGNAGEDEVSSPSDNETAEAAEEMVSEPKEKRRTGLFAKFLKSKENEEIPEEMPEDEEKVAAPSYRSLSGPLNRVPKTDADQIRVFVLGDSQGQTAFGPELRRALLDHGYEVLFHSVKNGSPYFWTGTWKSPALTRIYAPAAEPSADNNWKNVSMVPRGVHEYVDAFDPDIFVFQAGTNIERDLAASNPDWIGKLVSKCVDSARVKGAKVLWIGAPDARDDVRTEATQSAAVATMRRLMAETSSFQGYESFYDSRPVAPMSNSAGGDGEHPTVSVGKSWAVEAAYWIHSSIENFQCDETLRRIIMEKKETEALLMTGADPTKGEDPAEEVKSIPLKLKLVAKSEVGNPAELAYTDAFAMYQYEIVSEEYLPSSLQRLKIIPPGERDPFGVQVLHWALHNAGKGAALTKVTTWKEGEVKNLKLIPLEEHPLRGTISTIYHFDDFSDFSKPVFVVADVFAERVPAVEGGPNISVTSRP